MFREFLYVTRSDRRALTLLLAVGVIALIIFYGTGRLPDNTPLTAEDSVAVKKEKHGEKPHKPNAPWSSGNPNSIRYADANAMAAKRLAPFDPNTADSTQLLSLGLSPRLVHNIYRYREAGGIFRSKADFARLYGLTQGQYRELEPYIRISDDVRPAAELFADAKSEELPRDTLRHPIKLKEGQQVDLNRADTLQLRKVPGIGSYYAGRIHRYREQLGGFSSVEQLLEIENFPRETLPYFSINGQQDLRRMNLNKLELAQLRKHPYLNYYQARAICDYRRTKGPLHSLQDLRLLPEFTQKDLDRLAPYVTF